MAANDQKVDLSGIFPPIPTAFDENEDIDFAALEKNLAKWNKIPLRGIVVHGSNGEYAFLTKEEKVQLVKFVRKMTPIDRLVIAGAGCESTRDTISMVTAMSEAGADAALVITPCYYKSAMDSTALTQHFTKVADASPIPVILYSMPGFTGIDIPVETAVALASHPRIIGIKESGGNVSKIGLIVHKTKAYDFQVLAGSASFLMPAMAVGAVGGVCALANVLGNEVCELHRLAAAGSWKEAEQLQHKLIAPNMAVTRKFGVPGLKAALDKFGYFGGNPRSPLLPLPQDKKLLVFKDFEDNGFLP